MDNITASIVAFAIGALALAGTYWKPIYGWVKARWPNRADESSWRTDMDHCAALIASLSGKEPASAENPDLKAAVEALESIVAPAIISLIGEDANG